MVHRFRVGLGRVLDRRHETPPHRAEEGGEVVHAELLIPRFHPAQNKGSCTPARIPARRRGGPNRRRAGAPRRPSVCARVWRPAPRRTSRRIFALAIHPDEEVGKTAPRSELEASLIDHLHPAAHCQERLVCPIPGGIPEVLNGSAFRPHLVEDAHLVAPAPLAQRLVARILRNPGWPRRFPVLARQRKRRQVPAGEVAGEIGGREDESVVSAFHGKCVPPARFRPLSPASGSKRSRPAAARSSS